MILESIVTTMNAAGQLNVAPMGPTVPDDFGDTLEAFVLRPFATATTWSNLRAIPEGVLHVTDDVMLLAQASLGIATPATVPAERVRGRRLADCCRCFEFRIIAQDASAERILLTAKVVHQVRQRDFFGFNRGKFAIVEAAILATRVHRLPRDEILATLEQLHALVEKTGGPAEHEAFALIRRHVEQAG